MSSNKLRPSPSDSATLYKIGTVKKGNDSNNWIVIQTSNETHRWKKLADNKSNSRKNISKETLQLTNVNKLKKLTTIEITDKVGIGDFGYKTLDMKKGNYGVYKADDNLLLINSKYKVTKDFLKNILWEKTKKTVSTDSGYFGFFDVYIVEELKRIIGGPKPIKRI